jgi:hypothetical protein
LIGSIERHRAVKYRFLASCLIWSALAAVLACSSAKDRGAHWVALVQRAHLSADEYRKADATRSPTEVTPRDSSSTERALRQAISEAPDAPNLRERWVIQDLYYRLAQLLTDNAAMTRAAVEIERGLAVDAAPTLARANLLALHGKILEKQGEREAAAKAYHDALLVNEVLMDRALNGSAEEGSGQP